MAPVVVLNHRPLSVIERGLSVFRVLKTPNAGKPFQERKFVKMVAVSHATSTIRLRAAQSQRPPFVMNHLPGPPPLAVHVIPVPLETSARRVNNAWMGAAVAAILKPHNRVELTDHNPSVIHKLETVAHVMAMENVRHCRSSREQRRVRTAIH